MATLLAHNKTLKRLELRSDSLTQYKDAKRFTQHLLLGAAGSTTLTEVCIGFSSWRRDCHIQNVLCDILPVFEHVDQLVCLDIKDPQEQSTPELLFSLCISSLLKGAARSKRITSAQLAHSEEHQQHVEVVLTYLLTDLSVEERRRIGRGQCNLESGLVCPYIEVLPVAGSGKGKRSATEVLLFCQRKGGTALTKLVYS